MVSKRKPAVGGAKPAAAKKTPAAKKAPAAKTPAGKTLAASAEKRALLKSLDALLPRLDEERLAFLLEQARVHEYNMAVDKENRARSEALARGELFDSEGPAAGKHRGGKSGGVVRKEAKAPPALHLEKSDDGNTFHFVCEGRYKLFNAGEMTAMLKILSAKVSKKEADSNLLAWLDRERRDALSDLGVSGEVFIAFLRSRMAKRQAPRPAT